MIFLISFPDREKTKILCVLRVFVVHFIFFEPQNVASEMLVQNVHRVKSGSQISEIVGQKSVRSRQCYPARVVGGAIAEDLFDRGLCLPSGTAMINADLDRIIDIIMSCHQK